MDIAMNFTLGLSQGIAWPWPIAVYLFLAGISGGAVAVALMLNRYRNQVAENTPVLKAATLVGFVTIVLGMICLVADLTNPLVFWRILIYYNLTSVMSLGAYSASVLYPARLRAHARRLPQGSEGLRRAGLARRHHRRL